VKGSVYNPVSITVAELTGGTEENYFKSKPR